MTKSHNDKMNDLLKEAGIPFRRRIADCGRAAYDYVPGTYGLGLLPYQQPPAREKGVYVLSKRHAK